MERCQFIQICAASVAMAAVNGIIAYNAEVRFYTRARRVNYYDCLPLMASRLQAKQSYIVHYPFLGTPCFLLNVGKATVGDTLRITADGRKYRWKGGVGTNRSIVAYPAICAHRLAYPTRQIRFISNRGHSVNRAWAAPM
jgi:Rieske Fe-S protein